MAAKDTFTTRSQDWATRLVVPLAVMTVVAAAVALIVAAVHTGDAFAPRVGARELARDRGVAAASVAWATPLALTGIALLFSGIASSLARIRIGIRGRRDALVHALPRLIRPVQ